MRPAKTNAIAVNKLMKMRSPTHANMNAISTFEMKPVIKTSFRKRPSNPLRTPPSTVSSPAKHPTAKYCPHSPATGPVFTTYAKSAPIMIAMIGMRIKICSLPADLPSAACQIDNRYSP